jgi:hypothetical protein
MDGLKNYREKINSIEKLVNKMESGELSIHELVELETLTRDLHERSIILKYKAFENKMGDFNLVKEEIVPVEESVIEEIIEKVVEKEETPELDFSMFDAPKVPEEKEEVTPGYQISLTQNDSIEEVVEKTTPIIEIEPELVVEKVEVKIEEPKVEQVVEESIVVVKEKGTSFLDRLTIVDNSIGSQLGGKKLETLSGAFGINDRLLYINDLFDGSGEAFSDAIKTLDTQQNLDAASDKVEELAFKNSWNPEEEVVLEFLAIIKRRYA